MSVEKLVTIRRSHPSLPGHFPGNPVVPGVVILEEVLEAIRQSEPVMISFLGAPFVKFHTPLRPEEEMTIRLDPYQSRGRGFTCMTGERLIASGRMIYHKVDPSVRSQK